MCESLVYTIFFFFRRIKNVPNSFKSAPCIVCVDDINKKVALAALIMENISNSAGDSYDYCEITYILTNKSYILITPFLFFIK